MDVNPSSDQRTNNDGSSSVNAELYFLIARLLGEGPCRNASEALQRELETYGLLPKRIDWLGNEHDQTYDQVCRQFEHIGSNHLLQICQRLGPLVDKEVPTNVHGVHSLLGAGRQSILRRKTDFKRTLSRDHYVVRQNDKPRSYPIDLIHPPNSVPLLLSRELTGSIDTHSAAPAKLYSRVQLFCRTLGHLSAVYCVLFDRTGQYIFTGADDLLVKIWSAVTGRLLSTLRGASAEIADLAVSYDNSLLAAGSCDKIVRVWCLRTTAPIAVLTGHGGTITSINFCPADRTVRFLASTSSDGSVSFWEYITEPGQTPKFFPRPHKFNEKIRPGQAQMLCASFSPGGMFLATGCADHHVRVYAMFGQEGPERILELEAHGDRVDSIQWANSGLRFISGSKDGTAIMWRYEKQEWRTTRLRMTTRLEGSAAALNTESLSELGQKLKVTMVTWSRNDRWLITAVSDFSIKVWDSTNGVLHKELRAHEGEAFVLEPHPHDPNILLSAGHDGKLLIWDLERGEVMKSFLNFIEGQGHGAVFDAKWNPTGSTIAATDSHGHLSIYGIGPSERFQRLPKAIFFHTDYRPVIRDAHHHVLDEQTQLAPHLMPPPFLVDSEGNPYPPALQRLVPGREQLKDDQLVPTVVMNANGEQEILAGLEHLQPPPPAPPAAAAVVPEVQVPAENAEVLGPIPPLIPIHAPLPARTRSNIDQMIAELAQQQERQRNRPRSTSSASAGPSSDSPVIPSSRSHLPAIASTSASNLFPEEPMAVDVVVEQVQLPPAAAPTEATASESLPGFSRRTIVKPLTAGQLVRNKSERQACADEEEMLFFQEVQRKSPNIFLNTSVSPGIVALQAARSRGVSDAGWSPSRPNRRSHPVRPAQHRERPAAVVSSPARSRMPPVPSPRRNAMAPPAPSQNQPHNYRTRATRTTNGTRDRRRREDHSQVDSVRPRRVVRQVLSSDDDDGQEVDIEGPSQRTSRRAAVVVQSSPGSRDGSDDEEEGGRQTRSHAARRGRTSQTQRDGDALSTSDSNDSDSDSELASDLLGSDGSDSEHLSSSSSSSEYSDWTAEAGVNLEPPKRTRRKVYRRPRCLSSEEETGTTPKATAGPSNQDAGADELSNTGLADGSQPSAGPSKKRRPPVALGPSTGAGGLDRIPENFRPSEWLSEVVPRRSPFYPQMGDEIIYFRQGHELYVEAVNKNKLYDVNEKSLPWSNQAIREQELVKVIGIKYEIKPPRLCCLKLGLLDAASGSLTGESFTLKYHDMADVLDFLVLRQTYELAVQRNWKPGDRFRVIIDDMWWEGQLETREPYQPHCPDSNFLCYRVRWDNGDYDRMSPWDLEPVDDHRRPPNSGAGLTVLPAEIASTLYRAKAEDWPPGGDRDAECERISACFGQAMSLAIAEPFAAPVDLNAYPSYALVVEYPMDLSTIKARLDNRFYRRITAVQYDVRYVYTNACKFNEPKSDIVRSASIITDLCMEMIRNRDADDATALYHRLVEEYKKTPRDAAAGTDAAAGNDAAGPSGSRASKSSKNGTATPNTPNTRAKSRRNSPNSDSDSDHEGDSTIKGKRHAAASKSKDKQISTRIATAAALNWKQQCKDLLVKLWQMEDSEPFREPVSILDVPDYPQVIDHPMDLQTVGEQLQVSNYQTPMDFTKDMRLIFENSKNYNTNKRSRIYAMTVRLSCRFEEHIKSILATYKHVKSTANNHSKNLRSKKGKALASTNSHRRESRPTKQSNGGGPRERIKLVLDRSSRGQLTVQSNFSGATGSARRRILEEDEKPVQKSPSEAKSTVDVLEAKPGPSGLSSISAPSSSGAVKRRIVSDDDEEDSEKDEGEEYKPTSATTNGLTKGKALKRKKENISAPAAAVIKLETPAESSEDEIPISQRRRMVAAVIKTEPVKEEVVSRPSSSSSHGSNSQASNSSFSGSLCDDNGSAVRRSGRARRRPKRPLDSEQSENDLDQKSLPRGINTSKKATPSSSANRSVRNTRNGGRRTSVRYNDDSDIEIQQRHQLQLRKQRMNNRPLRSAAVAAAANKKTIGSSEDEEVSDATNQSDQSEEEEENEDVRVKQQHNGGVKRYSSRKQSETSKRRRTEYEEESDEESDDEDVDDRPLQSVTNSISSRGRVRRAVNSYVD